MRKAAILLACGLVLGLFAVQAPAQDEEVDWQAYRNEYDKHRTRYYETGSYARALAAAKTIFELADEEYEVATAVNGVVAHRAWLTLPGEGAGEAWWYVGVGTAEDGRIVVRVRMSQEPDPQAPTDLSSGRVGRLSVSVINPTETTTYELTDTDGAVGLFLMRMDWLMGANPYWLYCNAAAEYAKIDDWEGSLDAFCRQTADVRADRVPLKLPK